MYIFKGPPPLNIGVIASPFEVPAKGHRPMQLQSLARTLYGCKTSPAKHSEPVWTAIHITHAKTYT